MTPAERLLTVLRGGEVTPVPCSIYFNIVEKLREGTARIGSRQDFVGIIRFFGHISDNTFHVSI